MSESLRDRSTRFIAERHSLMAFIGGLVRDPHDAEDIFQNVWIQLADASEKGVEISDLPKWLRGVAKNLILRYWRDRRNDSVVFDSELADLAEQAFVEQDDRRDLWEARRAALVECMKQLASSSRDMLRLKYTGNLSFATIAGRVRRTPEAAMKAVSRARRFLKDCIRKRTGSDGTEVSA